jgi:hypothetical protein
MNKINVNLRWTILIAAVLVPASVSSLNYGFGQENETARGDEETRKSINYLDNARNLLNQTSVEYKNGNFTGAEELADTAYLDNFEHVEGILEEKASKSFMEDIEHMMREDLRKLIQDKADQSELDMHINATDTKIAEAIDLVKGTE